MDRTTKKWLEARERATKLLDRDGRYHETPHPFYSLRVGATVLHDRDTAALADKAADYLMSRED